MSTTAIDISTTITLNDQFSKVADGLNSKISGLESKLASASSSIGVSMMGNIGNPATAAFGNVKRLAGALGVGYLISRVVDVNAAFGRMDTMTNYNRTMTAITSSSETAKASLEALKEVTLGTAYGLDAAAKVTQGYVTRGMDTGNSVNRVRIMTDAVSFYGTGINETLSGAVDAWDNMYARDKVTLALLKRIMDDDTNNVMNVFGSTRSLLGSIMTKISDVIFGTKWDSGLSELHKNVLLWDNTDKSITLRHEIPAFLRANNTDQYNSAFNVSKSSENLFKIPCVGDNFNDLYNSNRLQSMPNSLANFNANNAETAKGMQDFKEEIKYIQDFAERKATYDMMASRTVTVEIKDNRFEMKSDVDINEFCNTLGRRVTEELLSGV